MGSVLVSVFDVLAGARQCSRAPRSSSNPSSSIRSSSWFRCVRRDAPTWAFPRPIVQSVQPIPARPYRSCPRACPPCPWDGAVRRLREAGSPMVGAGGWGGIGSALSELCNGSMSKTGACQPWRGRFVNNHCVEASSSFGSLIHAAVGIAGGSGGLRTKRSGWVS